MEPANKPPVNAKPAAKQGKDVEFLPDADEIELRPLPAFARITLPVLALALTAFVVWASLSELEQVVVARGRLINPLPNIVVQPLETSIVQKIEVRVGQVVRKGERLATLDPTFVQADEDQLRSKLRSLTTQSESLAQELSGKAASPTGVGDADARLQASLAGERRANFQAQLKRMEENIARLQASAETNRHDQDVLAARLKSVREMETMQEKLVAQQYGARMQLLAAQDKRLEVERDLLLTKNKALEIQRELAALQAEKAAFDRSWRQKAMEDMLVISRERSDVQEQLQKADKRHQLVSLTAPADGVVLEIAKLSSGSIVREAEAFFTLVPLSAQLEAEVQIDALDVGYMKPGDPVHVKIDAFPFQRHGDISAKLRTVSQDAFRRDSAQAQGLDAYYLGRVALGDKPLRDMPAHARLLPGMTLSAEIVVGKRTVLSYLLWPLTKAVSESAREP
ncbi:secretion protein HlyD [Massilia sp. Root418]|uniref:HlyD family type I secretion periplasmic adaptor subunit n=1 Tax=Massilia sp. Root418 TaxID=1736532 RepID=UPI0006FCAB85|nr:HlyD family type I secretion periplasmic adaptor subunit [Massilia sp. Root418]KQW99902.1 secretion protein HlyD [Massilia sp. Root418]